MRTYDGLFIFKDTVPEDRLKDSAARVGGEIEKAGGHVMETKPMGRRSFSRKLSKKDNGFYVEMTFKLDESKVAALSARYKLDDEVFRFQITRLDEKFLAPPPAPKPE